MKVLIVDDERMICEWLQFCIESRPDCQLCGCAHNGEQALELFKQMKPDVVFSDVKMPVMDGLELLRRLKALDPHTIVVLLTAFSEFDLARDALREGADDYLLKTEMNNQSFQSVLDRVEGRLIHGNYAAVTEKHLEDSNQNHLIIRNILKEERRLTQEDTEQLRECKVRWRDGGLFAVAIWKRDLLRGFKLPEVRDIRHVVGFEYSEFVYVMVGNLNRKLSELQKMQSLYSYAAKIVSDNQCMVGISYLEDHLIDVTNSVLEAVYALTGGYYEFQIKVLEPSVKGSSLQIQKMEWGSFIKRERQGLYGLEGTEYCSRVEAVLDWSLKEKVFLLPEMISYCWDAMEFSFVRYGSEDAPLVAHLLAEEKKKAEGAVTFEIMKQCVMDLIQESMFRQELDVRKLSKPVAAAVVFIRNHYRESIGLEQVALEVHLNAEYLSRVFKEEVGCTYSSFLSETRLKKAAYLLSHTSEKVQKIAEMVGYPNVSYFSTTFKKRYGVNPYEYRRDI